MNIEPLITMESEQQARLENAYPEIFAVLQKHGVTIHQLVKDFHHREDKSFVKTHVIGGRCWDGRR